MTVKQVFSSRGKDKMMRTCTKMKIARAKRATLLFFIVKNANLQCSCHCHSRGCLSSLIIGALENPGKSIRLANAVLANIICEFCNRPTDF